MAQLKSITESYIYNMLNKDNGIQKAILNLLESGMEVDKRALEEQLVIINKNFKFPLKKEVLNAYEEGLIQVRISKDSIMPLSMPFFLTSDRGVIKSIISLDSYGSINPEGNAKIAPKVLYSLLEGAYISLRLYENKNIPGTTAFQHISDNWANMVLRIFNKKFALNLDKDKSLKIRFLLNKFYLVNILQMTNEDFIYNVAASKCVGASPTMLHELHEDISDKYYKDINTFIMLLTEEEMKFGFKDLGTRSFLEAFISMYGATNLLSLELLPYFLFNLFSANRGSFINNQYALSNIIDKNVDKAYVSFV